LQRQQGQYGGHRCIAAAPRDGLLGTESPRDKPQL